jgi:hypothetical protein
LLSNLRARLTYANVMATIAVFIALGGSSYAAIKVTGKNVANSSLTGKDLKNESVTGRDVKGLTSRDFSEALPQGPQGAQGPQGTQGPQGERGEAGEPATRMFAVVNFDGSLRYGSPGVTSEAYDGADADGTYFVMFPQDVHRCAAVASLGAAAVEGPDAGANTGRAQGWAKASTASSGAMYNGDLPSERVITVEATDGTEPDPEALTESAFHLAVFC